MPTESMPDWPAWMQSERIKGRNRKKAVWAFHETYMEYVEIASLHPNTVRWIDPKGGNRRTSREEARTTFKMHRHSNLEGDWR